ncbi:6589_t:CDS:1 [Acaulospora morrowiae]|uniref:6589_t:CDS:1 n=1 Tax=Acaulospora morrowiae TaxID=94023 RepID=A0A9N9AWX1_9GLOM|nr:6589_t:CDS:1 [Acaulospora morrowiae]
MRFGVFFPKIKLTNRPRHNLSSYKPRKRVSRANGENEPYDLPDGHFRLTSFHKYQPRVKMIKHSSTSRDDRESILTFDETIFIAVTHYQNDAVNTLKKNHNPHAKGFKEMEGQCPVGEFSEESDNSDDLSQSEFFDFNEVENDENSFPQEEALFDFSTSSSQSSNSTLDHSSSSWRKLTGNNTPVSTDESPDSVKRTRPNILRRSLTDGCSSRQITINDPSGPAKVVKNTPLTTSQKQRADPPPSIGIPSGSNWMNSRSGSNLVTNFATENTPRKNQPNFSNSISMSSNEVVQGLHTPNTTPFGSIVPTNEFPWDFKHFNSENGEGIQPIHSKFKHSQLHFHTSPVTPITPENDYFSTSSPVNIYGSRLKRAENENRKLREFIRERYGAEAEKEADIVIAFGSNDESHR